MKKLLPLLVLLLTVSVSAQQSDDDLLDLSLEELFSLDLSLGSRAIKNPDQIPGAITVIEKDQILDMQARSLREVLNVLVPGMDVVPNFYQSGNPVGTGIYSRGILSDFNQQILILFNGENKFNESTFGSPFPGMDFTLENVERIEINNSPAPLLGGSALVTINIITKDQNLTGNEVFLNTGFNADDGFQSKRLTLNYGKYVNTWHIGSSLQYGDDQGNLHPNSESFLPSGSLRDGTQGSVNFLLNVKSPNDKLTLGTWYKNVGKDANFSNLNPSQSSNLYQFQTSTLHNYLKYKATESLDLSLGVSSFNHVNTFSLNRLIPVGVNQSLNVPLENSINNFNYYFKTGYVKDFDFLGAQTLFAGIKIEREGQSSHAQRQFVAESNGFEDVTLQYREEFGINLPDDDRTVYSIFAESNWNITEKFSLLYGFRFDDYENFGGRTITAFNPRIAVALLPSDNWIIRGLFATAVRPPSIYEIEGNNFLPQLFGNTEVTFEKLTTYEVSIKYKKDGFEINVNPYFEQFVDRINYVRSPLDQTAFVASNSGEVDVLGVEVSTKYNWGYGNYLFFNFSALESENKDTNEPTYFLPNFYLSGGANYEVGRFNLNSTFFLRNGRSLPADLQADRADLESSQPNVNVAVTTKISSGVSAYIQIQNALDADNFIPLNRDGFTIPLRGRTFNVGLNLYF